MTKLPAVFSGMAVLFGILMLVKFKNGLLPFFPPVLVGSGLSRISSTGLAGRWPLTLGLYSSSVSGSRGFLDSLRERRREPVSRTMPRTAPMSSRSTRIVAAGDDHCDGQPRKRSPEPRR